jgi:hypothetical protein
MPAMKSFLIIAFALCSTISASHAQSPTCSQFCITDIGYSIAFPEGLVVTLYFSSSDSNAFINYPYIAAVFDENGDTLATGTLNFFGQIANTSQNYPITSVVDSFPVHFTGSALFYYDTLSCLLSFPCTTSAFDLQFQDKQSALHVYPNPVHGSLTIETGSYVHDGEIELYNTIGQPVHSVGGLFGSTHAMSLPDVAPGMYYVILKESGKAIGHASVMVE